VGGGEAASETEDVSCSNTYCIYRLIQSSHSHFRLEKKKGEKFFLFNRYFTLAKYSGEQPTWDNAPIDELVSKEDYTLFNSCLRATTIEVRDCNLCHETVDKCIV